ncbi:type II secretion system protein [Parendozoicomonas haliclonae]|uniref:Uncharacterized protein n=1 Tax=Parendozoicomonas haliclonae TaxID=1960125 RepID=A0A1X7AQP7_9GAMM|nr:type II secretion system protein [Parendozoicomonas haliclonae]SMA50462.1 hypothetical protein EHSB41UT_04273 [Parendozoicomonas haliclonae]
MKRFLPNITSTCQLASLTAAIALSTAVYSTEQDDTPTTVIKELQQMLSAAKQYETDTGKVLQITADTDPAFGYLKIDDLIIDKGLPGWKGPYLPYNNDWFGKGQYVAHPDYIAAQLLVKEKVEWIRGSSPDGCKQSSPSCAISACIWLVSGETAKEINTRIDGIHNQEDEDAVGKVRYDIGLLGGIVCLTGDDYPPSQSSVK